MNRIPWNPDVIKSVSWKLYKTAVGASLISSAINGFIGSYDRRNIHYYDGDDTNIIVSKQVDKPINSIIGSSIIIKDTVVEGVVGGLFVALAPVTVPAYVYFRYNNKNVHLPS